MKNECSKTRPITNPYEVWHSRDGLWTWKVLKKYQAPDEEATNLMARWYCAVNSPFIYGKSEYGDVYVEDIKRCSVQVL